MTNKTMTIVCIWLGFLLCLWFASTGNARWGLAAFAALLVCAALAAVLSALERPIARGARHGQGMRILMTIVVILAVVFTFRLSTGVASSIVGQDVVGDFVKILLRGAK